MEGKASSRGPVAQLFRAEVLQHRQQSWIGDVQAIRPPSLRWLTALVVAVALATAAFLVLAQYTKKARVGGFLAFEADAVRDVVAPQPGTVLEARLHQGQHVQAGDVLFVLSTDVATRAGDTQLAIGDSLVAQQGSLRQSLQHQDALAAASQADVERRIAELQREVRQLGDDHAIGRDRLKLVEEALQRVRSLQAQNFVSDAHVRDKTEAVLAVRQELAALDRQRAAKEREIAALQAERAQRPLLAEVERQRTERELQRLAQQQAEVASRHQIVVRATREGTVGEVFASPGQPAVPGVPLAQLLPVDGRLQAHLYAPSSAVGFVNTDQPVQLRYAAFPYQKFGQQSGRVVAVSRTPLRANELSRLPMRPADMQREPLYRITVELQRQTVQAYGDERALSPGMQLEADVLLDRRRLIEWLFEPVIGMTGRV